MPLNWFCLIWQFKKKRYHSFVLVWKKFFCFGKVTFAHIWGFSQILGFEFCRLECNYVFLEISRKKQNSSKTGENCMESVGVMKNSPEKMVLSIATIWCFPIFLLNLEKIEHFYSPTETTNKKQFFFHTNRWILTWVPRLSRHLEISTFLVKSQEQMWKNTLFLEPKLSACSWARSAKPPTNEV